MTVYSGRYNARRKSKKNNIYKSYSVLRIINIALLSLFALTIFGNVLFSNRIASYRFQASSIQNDISSLVSMNAADKSLSGFSIDELFSFANKNGMVENLTRDTLFQNSGVAARF